MANATLVKNIWYAKGTDSSWHDGTALQSGTPSQGGNYRSKIAISTEGLVIGKSTKLAIAIKINNKSYPAHCNGILTDLDITDPGDVQNSNATGPSTMLSNAQIAKSIAYNANGTAYPSGWVESGSTFYLIFFTDKLQANKTYYVYVIRTATSNSWVKAAESAVTPTLNYTSYSACTAPTSFTASPEVFDKGVTLAWSGATGGTNNAITGYEIEYATSFDGASWSGWMPVGTATVSPMADTPGIVMGAFQKYRVRTIGAAGADYYSGWVESNPIRKYNPVVYIHNGTQATPHGAYIRDDGQVKRYTPYKFSGGEWRRGVH